MENPIHILAVASEFKGAEFIRECKNQGCIVYVIATERFQDHPWPHECIDQFHTMPDVRTQPDLKNAVSYFVRHHKVDRIVALDDFDVEHTADLREHLRIPGMGHSTARFFRDKLAMRSQAEKWAIPEPKFSGIFNYNDLHHFMQSLNPPWIFKPRMLAGSEGIRKIHDSEQLWQLLEELGDDQSNFLLEQFLPGDVFHVDSLVWQGNVVFSLVSQYGAPPLAALQGQGIFSTRILPRDSFETLQLSNLNQQVINAMGRDYGPTHSEFIRGEDGNFYFLETSARVAGGNIERVLESATDLKIWQEAAKMEIADFRGHDYHLPPIRDGYGGLIACPNPDNKFDINQFQDQEIRYRYDSDGFVSLVFGADSYNRIEELLGNYGQVFSQ